MFDKEYEDNPFALLDIDNESSNLNTNSEDISNVPPVIKNKKLISDFYEKIHNDEYGLSTISQTIPIDP